MRRGRGGRGGRGRGRGRGEPGVEAAVKSCSILALGKQGGQHWCKFQNCLQLQCQNNYVNLLK